MRSPNWTRDELILVLNLYYKIPYGQFNNRNKDVIELGAILGRTSGAVGYKLVNFVSLDPAQQAKGRKGAVNVGKLDIEVFNEFRNNWADLMFESEAILAKLQSTTIEEKFNEVIEIRNLGVGREELRTVKTRVNQELFRRMTLSNFDFRCAITLIAIPELLVASHIKPWSKDANERLNPANGLSLTATFDRAFDRGLITIDDELKTVYSSNLKKHKESSFYKQSFSPFENIEILVPRKVSIGMNFLKYHNDEIFLGA